jgi:putative oxidoreductase
MSTRSSTPFDLGALIARASLALLFVPAGFGKIAGFAGTAGYIASKGLPLPQAGAALAIAVELGLGLLLLAGLKTRWAALGLALFVAVATVVFHNFWALPAEQVMVQQLMFWKNVGIFGGLVLLASIGGGRWSLDHLAAGGSTRTAVTAA